MHWKFDIDQRALTRASDDLTVKSAKLAFPDKYPVKIEFFRGVTPFVFSGLVRATIKPVNQQTSAALAVSVATVLNGSVSESILNTNTVPMLEFVKKFGERPVALEILVTDDAGAEVASWTVNCELSRRYTGTADIAQDIPSLKATQSEAEAGVDNSKWMTPLRVFQAIAAYLTSSFQVTWAMVVGKPTTFPPSSHSHTWSELLGKPTTFPPSVHTHAWGEVTDKPTTFPPSVHTHAWGEVTDKPTTFSPSVHTHLISEVVNLQASLDAKAALNHTHSWTQITDKPLTFVPASHTHTLPDIRQALEDAGIELEPVV